MSVTNTRRLKRLVENAISSIGVDLRDLIVLTEAATGYFAVTPMIAALAGAERVYLLTRDSRYGTVDEVRHLTTNLATEWGLEQRIEFISRTDDRIGEADIVTNLNFVRPLDAPFLRRLKSTAAVPLMWETWEFRPEDIDMDECRRLGIPVLGTDEHQPELHIFEYVGQSALKALFATGFEVYRTSVCVVGSGEFASKAQATLKRAGANVTLLETGKRMLSDEPAHESIRSADALIVVEYPTRTSLIGADGEITARELALLNPDLTVIHICGGANRAELCEAGLTCWPESWAAAGYMTLTTAYVGPKPVVDLHAGGLKVGQHLTRARKRGLSRAEAEEAALSETRFAQAFAR